jgi:sulfur-oxidizing protein SoxA
MKPEANFYKLLAAAVLLASYGPASANEPKMVTADEYRAALQDKFANPGTMVIDEGEAIFKSKRGPNNVSLEKCDFGKGPGVLKGAYAELPRWFKDSNRVEDLESRLVTCMVNLQGFTAAEVKAKVFADQRANEPNTPIEAMAMYVAAQSDGMKIAPP